MALPTITKAQLGVTGYTSRQYMQPGEQDILLALVDLVHARTMIEIGVNTGLTARAVLQHCADIQRYVGIDVRPDYQFEIPAQQSERPRDPGWLVRGDPRFELALHGDPISLSHVDVVFIDGDHGRASVWHDSVWAIDVVKEGGIIIWHDYGNTTVQVTEVLDRLHANGRNIVNVKNTWLAYERR